MKNSFLNIVEEKLNVNLGFEVHKTSNPFSVTVMDTEFARTGIIIKEIKSYCEGLGYSVRNVYLFSAFSSDLQRERTNMETENKLIIYNNGKEYDVLCYMGCEVSENKE